MKLPSRLKWLWLTLGMVLADSTCISLPPLSSLRTSFVVMDMPLKSRVVSITRLEPSHFAIDLTAVAPPRPIT